MLQVKYALRWLLVLGGFLVATSVAFSLYSYFLVDYSLDSLESAFTVANKIDEDTPVIVRHVRNGFVEDAMIQQASREDFEFKDLAVLGMAVRSLEQPERRGGSTKAKIYLKQAVRMKKPSRSGLLRTLDKLFNAYQAIGKTLRSFFDYAQKRVFKGADKGTEVTEYSSLYLLIQAQNAEGAAHLEDAVDFYRKYLKLYPKKSDRGYVSVALAQALIRLGKIEEAGKILGSVSRAYTGFEEGQLAERLSRKIHFMKGQQRIIRELKKLIRVERDREKKDGLQLKLALVQLSLHQIDEAEAGLEKLGTSKNLEVRHKAKFFLGWAYKLKAEYDKGEKAFLDLLNEENVDRDLQLGMRAELADIYYQKNDVQASLAQYNAIAKQAREESDRARASQNLFVQNAMKEAWEGLGELEQGSIYLADLNDPESARAHLGAAGAAMGFDVNEITKRLEESSNVNLRDNAFKALKAKQVDLAFDLFSRNLIYHPDDAWTHSGIGTVYILLGDMSHSIDHVERGHKLEEDEYTCSALAYVYALFGRLAEGIVFYKRAIKWNVNYVPARFNLSCIYLGMRQYKLSLELLENVQRVGLKKSMQAKILNNLGYSYWWLGDKTAAGEAFREATRLDPKFTVAARNLDQIYGGKSPEQIAFMKE